MKTPISFNDISNDVIITNILSFLPSEDVMCSARLVNSLWNYSSERDVYIVSDTIKEEGGRRYNSLQNAINTCPDYATILILSDIQEPIHITDKILCFTTNDKQINVTNTKPNECNFQIDNARISFSHCMFTFNNTHRQYYANEEFIEASSDSNTIIAHIIGSESTVSFHSCQFDSISVKPICFCNIMHCSAFLQNSIISHFSTAIEGESSLKAIESSFLSLSDYGVHIASGTMSIHHCIFKCQMSCQASIFYTNLTSPLLLDDVHINRGKVGILLQGEADLTQCHISRCENIGILVDHSGYWLNVTLCQCSLQRCTEGIRCRCTNLNINKSEIKYCKTGCRVHSALCLQCTNSIIHMCKITSFDIEDVYTVEIRNNAIYDEHKVLSCKSVTNIAFVHNSVAFIKQYVFALRTSFKCCLITNNFMYLQEVKHLYNTHFYADDLFHITDNVMLMRESDLLVFEENGNERYDRDIRVDPLKREKGLTSEQLANYFFDNTRSFIVRYIAMMTGTIGGLFLYSWLLK